ncbi:MAG TPA: response regulator [Thermomicrobiales bacterium]|nr:response regulator [Thermomicrobiales bacterium]
MQDRAVGDITVLAVDDSASIRKLVELTLRREGYSVVTADSGLKALAELARQRPDLLLLDVMLVALDGFQLCRIIRDHPEYGDLPIVILSGRETVADREAGLRAGVSAYLTKPFRPEQLLEAVRTQLAAQPEVVA